MSSIFDPGQVLFNLFLLPCKILILRTLYIYGNQERESSLRYLYLYIFGDI